MLERKKTRKSGRSRQPTGGLSESFRRNNVVISRSQKEVTARQQSVTQRQVERKKHESRMRLKFRVICLLIAVAVFGILWRLSITATTVSAQERYKLTPQQLVPYQKSLAEDYPKYTVLNQGWLLDSDALSQAMIKAHPEIARLDYTVATPFSTTLKTTLKFRTPIFIWIDASQTEQYIDSEGVLFSKNYDPYVTSKSLVHIEDQSGSVLAPGTSVLTDELIKFVGQLHTSMPPLYGGVPIAKVVIPKSTREVQVQMSGVGYLVKFSSERPISDEVGELSSLLTYMKSQKITPASYIDLRVPNKAFYK